MNALTTQILTAKNPLLSNKTMKKLTDKVMMVRPVSFGYNEETAQDNAFQVNDYKLSPQVISAKAILEFDKLVAKLIEHDITVEVIQDTKNSENPDAVFPNNWISFHSPDYVVTYPMFAKKRRGERRESILETIKDKYKLEAHFRYEQFEANNKFLEGTGSMIFDRGNNIAYACKSNRTDEELFRLFCKERKYMSVLFEAKDNNNVPVYHTNVMMCLGNDFVVICMECIQDKKDEMMLRKSFELTGKKIIEISLNQMNQFAGNMIQLKNSVGECFLVMSSSAYNSLNDTQLVSLREHTKIIHSDLTTIETYGGGSARCMIAEIFLEAKQQ